MIDSRQRDLVIETLTRANERLASIIVRYISDHAGLVACGNCMLCRDAYALLQELKIERHEKHAGQPCSKDPPG